MQRERSISWEALLDRYEQYRGMPRWGAMTQVPGADGKLHEDDERKLKKAGVNAKARARSALMRFVERTQSQFPAAPATVFEDVDLLQSLRATARVGERSFSALWEALVFDRDHYTCCYCGRDAFEFWKRSGEIRTLRLVVDHRDPNRKKPGVYESSNCATACWSCNTMKGPFPEAVFLEELDEIVKSRLSKTAGGK